MASNKIQLAVERFVDELREIVAEEAKAALMSALSGEQISSPISPRRGPGRPPGTSPRGKAGKRVRRTAADLEAIQGTILATLKKQPGVNSEELQDALGLEKKDIQRPLYLLKEEGKVKTEGQKRAMRYYPKGRG